MQRMWRALMAMGAYPGETAAQAGRRRIVVGYMVFGIPLRLLLGALTITEGLPAAGLVDILAALPPAAGLLALRLEPLWYRGIVNVLLGAIIVENLVPTVMRGGVLEAELFMAWTVLAPVGALIALSRRAGFWWFVAFLVSLVLAVVLPEWIDPIYDLEPASAVDVAASRGGAAIFVYAGMAYFVRQGIGFSRSRMTCCATSCPARSPLG
ncbi:MAG TPA: hypothetical protein VGC47_12480 [Acidimicrobiia bacterium]